MLLYTCGRDVGALDAAEASVKDLLLSSSFDLRAHAQTISAAAALLSGLPAVAHDSEAVFFADAINSSCSLLLGACAGCLRAHAQRLQAGAHLCPSASQA